jgi:hypothetical protein
MDRRLDGLQSRSGSCGEREKYFVIAGNQTRTVQAVAHRYTDWAVPALTGYKQDSKETDVLIFM